MNADIFFVQVLKDEKKGWRPLRSMLGIPVMADGPDDPTVVKLTAKLSRWPLRIVQVSGLVMTELHKEYAGR